jgi:hypothetical protein
VVLRGATSAASLPASGLRLGRRSLKWMTVALCVRGSVFFARPGRVLAMMLSLAGRSSKTRADAERRSARRAS